MKLLNSSFSLLLLLIMATFTILTAPGTCHPLPKKHRWTPHGPAPDKYTMVEPSQMSTFPCVQQCVAETSGYLNVRYLNQHQFCVSKGSKADDWMRIALGGCCGKVCDDAHKSEIKDQVNQWYADFCYFGFG